MCLWYSEPPLQLFIFSGELVDILSITRHSRSDVVDSLRRIVIFDFIDVTLVSEDTDDREDPDDHDDPNVCNMFLKIL